MNHKSIEFYYDEGGDTLLGKSLLDCHPEPSRSKLKDLLRNPRPNTYLTQSKGEKLFVHQTPWSLNGIYMGFVEIIIRLPSPAEA